MSTRSYIGKLNKNGLVTFIYCHSDGYPAHVGALLGTFYNSEKIIDELMELGDLSSLWPKLKPTGEHSFEKREEGVTVAYGRDRGEKGTNARKNYTEVRFATAAQESDAEYCYLFKNGSWHAWECCDEILYIGEMHEIEANK